MYIVYIHKNMINGKVYIGKTCQTLEKRSGSNGIGYRNCNGFYPAIKKYGWDNFKHIILFSNLTAEEANKLEKKMIVKYNSRHTSYGYNIRIGGQGMESEDSLSLWSNPEYVDKIKLANKKNWEDPGYKESMKTKMKLAWKDPDKRKRRSEAATKRWANNDFRKKASEAVLKACGKAVECIETGKIYETVKSACEELHLQHGNMCRAIKNGYKIGGYHWKYANIS